VYNLGKSLTAVGVAAKFLTVRRAALEAKIAVISMVLLKVI
jgi:hypothetical protein